MEKDLVSLWSDGMSDWSLIIFLFYEISVYEEE